MATHAAHLATKGPLSSALGQWIFLGFGTLALCTGDNGVSNAAKDIAGILFRLVTGRDGSYDLLLREAALNNSSLHSQQPIVIHSSSSTTNKGWTASIIQVGLGAVACWTTYVVFSNFLPEQIKEMMPVTRKFFESAVTSLGQGIIRVRDALGKQIATLGVKQDELGKKQDETHVEVLGLKDDICDVRINIDDIAVAISRCENSLSDAAGRQNYMSRGVRLLVQCVGDMLRPINPSVAEELDQFNRLNSEMMDGRNNDSNGGGVNVQPSSPNLSEIGSASSKDEHRHHLPQHHNVPSSSPANDTASNDTPSRGTHNSSSNGMINASPLMSTPVKQMLHSFRNRNVSNPNSGYGGTSGCGGASSSTPSRGLPPENEVPLSNNYHTWSGQGHVTPMGSE